MVRVAAYCRVSTDKEDQANSFETQQRYFRECVERNPNWELQDIYADEGLSGTNTKKRKQFHAMICAAKEGKIDLIITKEVSRFARNTLDTLEYTRALQKLGIAVIFLIDNINTLDADGELRLTIMASLAQEESRKTSHRVKWGQTESMKKGVVFGSSLLGYDVIAGRMTVNQEGAETVKYIFHKYLNERKGSSIIARELREEGIVSSRGNLKWSASTILKILKNEKYCGDLIQKKTYTPDFLSHEKKYNHGQEAFVVIRDHHEPIIDRYTWDTVQCELRRRNRGDGQSPGRGNRYPLSGKIKCADCGSSFLVRSKKTRSGNHYKVWRCGKATREGILRTDAAGNLLGCSIGTQLRDDVAMEILKRSVQAVQMDSEAIICSLTDIVEDVLKASQNNARCERRRLERELEGERTKKQRAMEKLFDGTISESDFQFMNQRCDQRITQINHHIAAIERREEPATHLTDTESAVFAAIDSIVKGKMCSEDFCGSLLHQMTVSSEGRIEVTLNYLSAQWTYKIGG